MKNKKYKLVVYVPVNNAPEVREVMGKAGGGKIGDYSSCSFSVVGIGRFKPEDGANPYVGEIGEHQEVEEERIEMTVDAKVLDKVIGVMKEVHPYQEVAYDVYLLEDK
jgi:hypothetical protein